MGIAFSHCEASWSYSGFHSFRRRLAGAVAIELMKMEGFSENGNGNSWKAIVDPIVDLLHHSDCDGILTPEQCKKIAPRLRQIVECWDDTRIDIGYDKRQALELAEGMEKAASLNENLIFC